MKLNDESSVIDDLFISYTDEGNDKNIPIVFIHGFPLDKSMWKGQFEYLRNKYRVITYDIRGYGDSEPGTETLSIDLFASDLKRLLDALDLPKVILCGFSMGGYIALKAMEKFPERVDALILSDTQCSADSAEAKEKRMKAIHLIKTEGLQPYVDQILSGFFFGESTDTKSKEIIEVRRTIEGSSVDVVCNTLQALADRIETCSNLNKIKIPVLILVGNEDQVTPPAASELMQSKIAGSVLYRLENSAHLSNIDNAVDFNKHLDDFLELVIQKKL
jgi:3-oxoadipate enol-lactonase